MGIIERVKKFNFPFGEYVVVGSGILDALGLRHAKDIDLAVSTSLLKTLKESGAWEEENRNGVLFLKKDDAEVITKLDWDKYPTSAEEAIRTALMIDGVPFLNIEETIKFKTALGREKDFTDIELIRNFVASKNK